jgi:hypothetical protein
MKAILRRWDLTAGVGLFTGSRNGFADPDR